MSKRHSIREQNLCCQWKSVTFTGASANETIPSINRSFVYKAKEGRHVRICNIHTIIANWFGVYFLPKVFILSVRPPVRQLVKEALSFLNGQHLIHLKIESQLIFPEKWQICGGSHRSEMTFIFCLFYFTIYEIYFDVITIAVTFIVFLVSVCQYLFITITTEKHHNLYVMTVELQLQRHCHCC